MNDILQFQNQVNENIERQGQDQALQDRTIDYLIKLDRGYTYNFTWMGLPIIQFPQDIMAMQELIFKIKPDLIIETGVARGGSLVFYASLLELLGGDGEVVGVDIDIRQHNREQIENHPMSKRISLIQGSSIDSQTFAQVQQKAQHKKNILVVLDSNHTHEHVLAELQMYAPLVSVNSYCVVFDTIVEDLPKEMYQDRLWGPGDNPKTAVHEYLKRHPEFEIDSSIHNKLLITVAPDGYLKRIS